MATAKALKCPNCGSENVSTERRPNGYHHCKKCGRKWKNEPATTGKPAAGGDAKK